MDAQEETLGEQEFLEGEAEGEIQTFDETQGEAGDDDSAEGHAKTRGSKKPVYKSRR